MPADWYYRRDDKTEGPVYREDIENLLQLGMIDQDDLVWQSEMAEWTTAGEQFDVEYSQPPTPPPPPPPKPAIQPPPTSAGPPSSSSLQRRKRSNPATLLIFMASATVVVVVGGFWLMESLNNSTESDTDNRRSAKVSNSKKRARSRARSQSKRPVRQQTQIRPTRTPPSTRRKSPAPRISPNSSSFNASSKTGSQPLPGGGTNETLKQSPAVVPPGPVQRGTGNQKNDLGSEPPLKKKVISPSAKKANPTSGDEPIRRKPLQLYQDLLVNKQSSFTIAGLPQAIKSNVRYRVLSSLYLSAMDSDRQFTVKQKILQTKLESADFLTKATLEKSLNQLVGQEFTFTLNKQHQVVKFAGYKQNKQTLRVQPGAKLDGFMVTSVMDADGWKEIAQLSFFVPDRRAPRGQWQQEMTHDWGPLGRWTGNTRFARGRPYSGLRAYTYVHQMKYSPSKGKKKRNLPIAITAAKFSSPQASGTIYYDEEQHRVSRVEETFRAQGSLQAKLLGQSKQFQVQENQKIQIRIADENPWQ